MSVLVKLHINYTQTTHIYIYIVGASMSMLQALCAHRPPLLVVCVPTRASPKPLLAIHAMMCNDVFRAVANTRQPSSSRPPCKNNQTNDSDFQTAKTPILEQARHQDPTCTRRLPNSIKQGGAQPRIVRSCFSRHRRNRCDEDFTGLQAIRAYLDMHTSVRNPMRIAS